MKIKNDKYYTPKDLAKYLINKTIEIIGTNNITDIIEPYFDYIEGQIRALGDVLYVLEGK